jgi:membrane protease YdiL (CAAX protease family)
VGWGLGDALLGLALTLLVPAVVGIVAYGVAGWEESADVPLWAVALLQVPLWVGLLGVPLWASRTKGAGSLARDFRLRMRWTDVPLGLLAGFAIQIVLGIVVQVVYELFDVDTDKIGESARELTDAADDVIGVVLLVLVVVVAAPIFEELFYRGLWLRAAERRWGVAAAVLVSSFVFAAVHFSPYDFPALFAFAVAVAVLTVVTGRLGLAIWAHVAFNLTAVVALLAES